MEITVFFVARAVSSSGAPHGLWAARHNCALLGRGVDACGTRPAGRTFAAWLACAPTPSFIAWMEALYLSEPRPWQRSFTLWCDEEDASTGQLFDALALAEPRLVSLAEPPVVAERDWPLASLRKRCHRAYDLLDATRCIATLAPVFRHEPGWTLGVTRRTSSADDPDETNNATTFDFPRPPPGQCPAGPANAAPWPLLFALDLVCLWGRRARRAARAR